MRWLTRDDVVPSGPYPKQSSKLPSRLGDETSLHGLVGGIPSGPSPLPKVPSRSLIANTSPSKPHFAGTIHLTIPQFSSPS